MCIADDFTLNCTTLGPPIHLLVTIGYICVYIWACISGIYTHTHKMWLRSIGRWSHFAEAFSLPFERTAHRLLNWVWIQTMTQQVETGIPAIHGSLLSTGLTKVSSSNPETTEREKVNVLSCCYVVLCCAVRCVSLSSSCCWNRVSRHSHCSSAPGI